MRIEERGDGFALCGALTREYIAELWPRGLEKFTQRPQVHLDLSGVTTCDSAGVAMLVDWLRITRSNGHDLRFHGAPQQMLAIARVAELMPMLDDRAGRQ